MSKTITGAMPIRTVGLTPGHRWCGGLHSVRPAVNNGEGARGLVHGPNNLNATYIRQGRTSDRPRKLAKDLRNGHLVPRLAKRDELVLHGNLSCSRVYDGCHTSFDKLLPVEKPAAHNGRLRGTDV